MKLPTNRNFGIVFFIIFLLISIWPIIDGQSSIRLWSLVISLIFLALGILNSKLLSPLNFAWMKLGEILGKIIAPIVMSLIFFIVITPIGLLKRLTGKDLLKLKFSKKNSYWIKRNKTLGSMKRQF